MTTHQLGIGTTHDLLSVITASGGAGPAQTMINSPGRVLDTEMTGTTFLALMPLFLLLAGLVIYALVDLVKAPSVRYMPKVVWALVIVLGSAPLGALAYLLFGRGRNDASTSVAERADGRRGITGRRLSRYERGLRL